MAETLTKEVLTPLPLDVASDMRRVHGQDALLVDKEFGTLAVFDAHGPDGAKAAEVAQETTQNSLPKISYAVSTPSVENALKEILGYVHNTVKKVNQSDPTETTGTTASIGTTYLLHGEAYWSWAAVGDSRIYIFNRLAGSLEQLNQDEAVGVALYNSLGEAVFGGDSVLGLEGLGVQQAGTVRLNHGDEIIICSDGVTGHEETPEHPSTVLEESQITQIMQNSESPAEAAHNLVTAATEWDDAACTVARF